MEQFKLIPILNKVKDMSENAGQIKRTTLCNTLENGLCYGLIEFEDAKSEIFDSLDNIQVGARVDLKIVYDDDISIDGTKKSDASSVSDDIKNFHVDDLVVLRIMNKKLKGESNSTTIIYFGHKLFLYKDLQNRAFPPISNEKLIANILDDASRGCFFKLKEFDVPDEEAIKRYKTLESDWEFMKNKVANNSSYKKTPMYLYSDLNNEFHFISIHSMMNSQPEIAIYDTNVSNETEDEDAKAFNDLCQANSVEKTEIYMSCDLDIGNKDAVAEMAAHMSYINSQIQMVKTTTVTPATVNENDASEFSKYYPIDYGFEMFSKTGAAYFTIDNHIFSDIFALKHSAFKDFDRMITISVDCLFNAEFMNIGKSILMFFRKGHWANGKWILFGVKLVVGDNGQAVCRLTLGRPFLTGDKDNTTLKNYLALFHRLGS